MKSLRPAILLIEDDERTIETVQFILKEEGYTVSVAGNGEVALNLLSKSPSTYQLILLDLVMPKVDGFEVLSSLSKKIKEKIPIIVFSNLGRDQDKEKARALGAAYFLTKSELSIFRLRKELSKFLPKR